jgi:hypothetical protein
MFEGERLREKVRGMSEEKFYGAQNRMNELRDEATKLARPIFERLTSEFDATLHSVALPREEELQKMRVALFSDRWTDRGEVRDYCSVR